MNELYEILKRISNTRDGEDVENDQQSSGNEHPIDSKFLLASLERTEDTVVMFNGRFTMFSEIHGKPIFVHIEIPLSKAKLHSHIENHHINDTNCSEHNWFVRGPIINQIKEESIVVLKTLLHRLSKDEIDTDKDIYLSYTDLKQV